MKVIKKTSLLLVTAFLSLPTFAAELTQSMKIKVASVISQISDEEVDLLEDGESLFLEIEKKEIELNLDLVKKLENEGILRRDDVAEDGARCFGR